VVHASHRSGRRRWLLGAGGKTETHAGQPGEGEKLAAIVEIGTK